MWFRVSVISRRRPALRIIVPADVVMPPCRAGSKIFAGRGAALGGTCVNHESKPAIDTGLVIEQSGPSIDQQTCGGGAGLEMGTSTDTRDGQPGIGDQAPSPTRTVCARSDIGS
jgi:hypothetical protein